MKNLVSAEKIFRQIDSLVETLFSRNFCQRCVTVKLRIFDKNFVKVKFFLKRRLDEIFLVIVNFSFFHTVLWVRSTRLDFKHVKSQFET